MRQISLGINQSCSSRLHVQIIPQKCYKNYNWQILTKKTVINGSFTIFQFNYWVFNFCKKSLQSIYRLFNKDQDTKDIFMHPNKPPLGPSYTKTIGSLWDELTWRTGGTSSPRDRHCRTAGASSDAGSKEIIQKSDKLTSVSTKTRILSADPCVINLQICES